MAVQDRPGTAPKVVPDEPLPTPLTRGKAGRPIWIGTPCRPNQAKEPVLTIVWILIVIILVLLAIALVRRVL